MKVPEQFRWANAPHGYASQPDDPFGAFLIPGRAAKGRVLRVIACDGAETGWDHVSVSLEDKRKCPSWEEMCVVKRLFWNDSETVVQFHPPESDYINQHPGCLHLWRCVRVPFPMPPKIYV
jgi:hypothetical protein